MNFKMNNYNWTIDYATADEVKKVFNDNNENSYYYGATKLSTQQILINKEVSKEKQKETLYHELMHCYIWSYLSDEINYNEEILCDLSSKSHDMIHDVCKNFFN